MILCSNLAVQADIFGTPHRAGPKDAGDAGLTYRPTLPAGRLWTGSRTRLRCHAKTDRAGPNSSERDENCLRQRLFRTTKTEESHGGGVKAGRSVWMRRGSAPALTDTPRRISAINRTSRHSAEALGQTVAFSWSVKVFQVSGAKASWGPFGFCCDGSPRPGRLCRPRRRFRRCCRCSCSCARRRRSRPSFLGHFSDQVAGGRPRLGSCPDSIERESDMIYHRGAIGDCALPPPSPGRPRAACRRGPRSRNAPAGPRGRRRSG